jgi:hypothetical protein
MTACDCNSVESSILRERIRRMWHLVDGFVIAPGPRVARARWL